MSSSPLSNPLYRKLFAAQFIALTGTGLSTIALALLAYSLAGEDSGLILGAALAVKMVAYIVISPIVGGVAHRLPRKSLLIVMDLIRALLLALLPWVEDIWQIYLIIFIISSCSATFKPVYQAIIPEILPDQKEYTKALSLFRIAYDMENLLSPALAALLLMVASFKGLFILNAIAFLISALLVMITTLPKGKSLDSEGSIRQEISFGLKAYLKTPRLQGLLALYVGVAAASSMVIVNTAVYVQGVLQKEEINTAWAMLALGAGSILSAFFVPRLLEVREEKQVMLAGGALLALSMGLGVLAPDYGSLLFIWSLLGIGLALAQTPTGRLIVASCQPADRTALFAAHFSLSHGCWFIGYLLAGFLSSQFGIPQTFLLLTLLILVSLLVAYTVWSRQEGHSELEHDHCSLEHSHIHDHDDPHHQHSHPTHENSQPHSHLHHHPKIRHSHPFVIDRHHISWPKPSQEA
jgi:MFS family permease